MSGVNTVSFRQLGRELVHNHSKEMFDDISAFVVKYNEKGYPLSFIMFIIERKLAQIKIDDTDRRIKSALNSRYYEIKIHGNSNVDFLLGDQPKPKICIEMDLNNPIRRDQYF